MLVKTSKPPSKVIPHVPSGKADNVSQANPGKGQMIFYAPASTVCKVKKATKTHTEPTPPYLIIPRIYAHRVRQDVKCTAKFIFCAEGRAPGSNTEIRLSAGPQPSYLAWLA